ncbi:MAG: three-Cys-motif partner protein TcmP [Bryobacterales bacterium]|nr:three-Cys-motif partner protein TcmP [Bryobacterales bacterium]
MPFPARPAQTRVKHEIVRQYSGAWAGIIVNGVVPAARRRVGFVLDLVYLEGFAGFGRYLGDMNQPDDRTAVWGSPVIGLQQLEAVSNVGSERGITVRVTGILVDLNRDGQIEELKENLLAAGIETPITCLQNASGIRKGRVNLISGDFRDHVNGIVDSIQPRDFVLAFLDPYGESMRMDSLARILGRPKTDSIVLFPTARVDRLGGCVAKLPRDRDPRDSSNIRRINHLYGDCEWQKIAIDREQTRKKREIDYGILYRNRVREIDEDLWVKNIALRFTGMNREAYSLLLTTRDADGGMRMNDILRKAEARKHWLLWEDLEAKLRSREAEMGSGNLFPDWPRAVPPTINSEAVSKEHIIPSILDVVLPGEELQYKALLGKLCDTPYLTREINTALRYLRDQRHFAFDKLRKSSTLRRLR